MASVSFRQNSGHASLGNAHRTCPLCGSPELFYEFIVDRYPACGCGKCGLLFLNPPPGRRSSVATVEALPNEEVYEIHALNASNRFDHLRRYLGRTPGPVLLVSNDGHLQTEARNQGCDVTRLTPEEFIDSSLPNGGSFDACILDCALERMTNPIETLKTVRQQLRDDGAVMIISPTLDSRTARLFGSSWWEFNSRNLFYFTADTLQNAVVQSGFGDPIVLRDDAVVSLRHFQRRLAMMPRRMRYGLVKALIGISPGFLRDRAFRFLYSRTIL